MKVKEFLPKVRANRYTFFNLDNSTKKDFRKLYSYLKKHENRNINSNNFQGCNALIGQINFWLENKNEMDYIKKIKAMQLISTNLTN